MLKNFLLYLFCISLIVSGCGDKNEKTETSEGKDKSELKSEDKKENLKDPSESQKQEETTVENTGENTDKANELGMTPGMPKDFPQDIPLPKNSKTLGSLNSSEGTVVTFESKDKVQDIVNFYKEELKKNGYVLNEEGETLVSDKGGLINWTKEKKEVGLMLGYDKDKDITSLVITYR